MNKYTNIQYILDTYWNKYIAKGIKLVMWLLHFHSLLLIRIIRCELIIHSSIIYTILSSEVRRGVWDLEPVPTGCKQQKLNWLKRCWVKLRRPVPLSHITLLTQMYEVKSQITRFHYNFSNDHLSGLILICYSNFKLSFKSVNTIHRMYIER